MSRRKVEKPWGYEDIWAETNSYAAKIIYISKGNRLSKQFHKRKVETIYVLSGILVNYDKDDEPSFYSEGEVLHIEPGRIHRFGATELESVTLVEVSTTELDDVIRLEDDYGR